MSNLARLESFENSREHAKWLVLGLEALSGSSFLSLLQFRSVEYIRTSGWWEPYYEDGICPEYLAWLNAPAAIVLAIAQAYRTAVIEAVDDDLIAFRNGGAKSVADRAEAVFQAEMAKWWSQWTASNQSSPAQKA